MSSTRVFIGRLSSRASERDVEHFFRGYGKLRDIVLKNGFGFVEFDSSRDADDAIYDLNGKELGGERVTLEFSRSAGRGGGGRGFDRGPPPRRNDRYGPPTQTRHRIRVENLSTRISWQDLKDMMRSHGEVTFADAHKQTKNEGIVCFASREDLKRAMDKMQGKDVNGRRLKLIDDSEGRDNSRSRSRTRSVTPRRRSRSATRSRSRSPRDRKSQSRSASRSRSRSPAPAKEKSRSRSRSDSRSRSASPEN